MSIFTQLILIALLSVWLVGVLTDATFGYGGYGFYGGPNLGMYGLASRYGFGFNPYYYRPFGRKYDPFYTSRGGYFNRGRYGSYYGGYYG